MNMVLVSVLAAISAGAQGPQWMNDYGQALKATKAAQQPLLLVLSAQQGKSDLLQSVSLDSYQVCHVDVSTNYGQKVADAFRTTTFPYVAIIDKTASYVLTSRSGAISSQELSTLLQSYKPAQVTTLYPASNVASAASGAAAQPVSSSTTITNPSPNGFPPAMQGAASIPSHNPYPFPTWGGFGGFRGGSAGCST